MALSDLAVFSEQTQTIVTEIVDQQINLFNEASRGAIVMRQADHAGDFSDVAFYGKISGLVRRRNPYATGAQAHKALAQIIDTMVKVAGGTPPIDIDPNFWNWIARDPAEAAAVISRQLALDMMQDMLNAGAACAFAALSGNPDVQATNVGETIETLDMVGMQNAKSKFGDAATNIVAWLVHSTPMFGFWNNSITGNNGNQFLFRYETLNIVADPWGTVYIVSDIPALVTPGTPNTYSTLGLAAGAIRIDRNNDFIDNVATLNGDENISRTYQAEWSYNIGILGYAWDKQTGGRAPNDAALASSANWDKIATSDKNTAGVILTTK